MLRLFLLLILAALPLQLCGCDPNRDPAKKAAIDEIERRHAEDMVRMGSGGGM